MNRRALLLAGLAALPATALPRLTSAQRRTTRRQQASGTKPATRRQRGELTASHVRTRVVTRTFSSAVPITMADIGPAPASPYPATIQVSGFNQGRILKVRVTLVGFNHSVPADVDVLLVAPGNAVGVVLMSDAGGNNGVANIDLTFDQDAPGVPPDKLVAGTFQPANFPAALDPFPAPAPQGITGHSLTRFTNRNPNGAWRLYVVDDTDIYGGSLSGWALTIRARVSIPHRHRQRTNQRQRPARRAAR